jgi:hypothetical protein
MNKTQHTPGPWHIGRRAGNPAIYAQDGAEVAQMLTVTNDDWRDNARLIAAAPDLLAALKECMTEDGARCLAYGADTPTLRRRLAAINSVALAALAKAQGEGGAE